MNEYTYFKVNDSVSGKRNLFRNKSQDTVWSSARQSGFLLDIVIFFPKSFQCISGKRREQMKGGRQDTKKGKRKKEKKVKGMQLKI